MYPAETYPFFARLDEALMGGQIWRRGLIVRVIADIPDFNEWVVATQTLAHRTQMPYASLTPLCQVCDEQPAVGLGVHHPTTLQCTACLEGEPGCIDGAPQCIGCDLAQNPYEHDSSYSGCASDCRACAWDEAHTFPSEPGWCDHNHQADEVRRLPAGGEGAMLLCRRHYNAEMTYRATSGFASIQEFPSWDSLAPYTGA